MALTEENGMGTTMLVQPSGGNGMGGLFGGDLSIIVLFFLFMMLGGWGGMGGVGGFDGLYPWMNNSQNINNGFRDQMLNDNIGGIRDGIAGIGAQISNLQVSGLERSFAAQTANTAGLNALQGQLAQCCCDNRLATADTKYTIATEGCATRTANAENTSALLTAFNAGIQSIKDQLCQDKIDAKNDLIAQLRQEVLFARGQASQDVQTAALRAGQATTANQLVQELRSCPIPSMPVYGMTPVFTCPSQGNTCGCNCGCGLG